MLRRRNDAWDTSVEIFAMRQHLQIQESTMSLSSVFATLESDH